MKLIFTSIIAILIISCQMQEKQKITQVTPTVFSEKIVKHKGQLIDVRTQQEYQSGHIQDAINIHIYDNDFEEQLENLNKDEPVYVYCKAGGRSSDAVEILKEKGFNHIVELNGGTDAWKEAGKPLEK